MNPPMIASDISAYTGKEVIVFGLISRLPAQHIISSDLIKTHEFAYFDLDQADQTMVYVPKAMMKNLQVCKGPLRLVSKVFEVKAPPKKTTDTLPTKHEEESDYREYHLEVKQARCLSLNQPETWLFELGNQALSEADKNLRLNKLRQAGKLSFPDLILHLSDQRIVGSQTVIPGEAINAPNGATIPEVKQSNMTAGQKAEDLLYELITPVYDSPYRFQGKVLSESMFHVADWAKWWKAHKQMTLDQIREQNKVWVDRYWQEHGSTQVID